MDRAFEFGPNNCEFGLNKQTMLEEEDAGSEADVDLAQEHDTLNQLQEVLQQLRNARANCAANVHTYMQAMERLIRVQPLLVRNQQMLRGLHFELLFDVLYDYGRDLSPFRDELHVFAAAIDWLCHQPTSGAREQFSAALLSVVRFEHMSGSQLRAAFELVSRIKLTPTLKHLLQQTQKKLIAQNLLHHSSVFIDCLKI